MPSIIVGIVLGLICVGIMFYFDIVKNNKIEDFLSNKFPGKLSRVIERNGKEGIVRVKVDTVDLDTNKLISTEEFIFDMVEFDNLTA